MDNGNGIVNSGTRFLGLLFGPSGIYHFNKTDFEQYLSKIFDQIVKVIKGSKTSSLVSEIAYVAHVKHYKIVRESEVSSL